MYDVPRGPLPPVVIREPECGKYQPLLEVPGKGKAKLGLTDSEEESKEDVPGADAGGQGEGQAEPDPGAQDKGQAGSNPNELAEGQAGPDPGNARADKQPMPSPVVHAGSDREHIDLDVVDVSPQPPPKQMNEGLIATAYSKVQENLKITVEEQVILEEPASVSETLSSLQHLTKDLRFVTKAVDEVVTDAVDWAMQAPLWNRFRELPEADMKEILHQRMWETDSYKSHEDHMQLYEALEKSMNRDHSEELAKDLAEAFKNKKKSRESPKTPPGFPPQQPPPSSPPAAPSRASGSTRASGSS
nr:hypothetical protein [Tanacetum cinerariifolium]